MEWNKKGKYGVFELGGRFVETMGFAKLKRYDYEDYDIYVNTNNSIKIFVVDNSIRALQFGGVFLFEKYNLIGLPVSEIETVLKQDLTCIALGVYYCIDLELTVYVVDNVAKWITVSKW